MYGGLSLKAEMAKAEVQEKYPTAFIQSYGKSITRFCIEEDGQAIRRRISSYCVNEGNAWISAASRIEKAKARQGDIP